MQPTKPQLINGVLSLVTKSKSASNDPPISEIRSVALRRALIDIEDGIIKIEPRSKSDKAGRPDGF